MCDVTASQICEIMGLFGKFIKKKMKKAPLPKVSQLYIVQIGGEI